MSLTNTAIRNVKAAKKAAKLFDERGLYLEASIWRQVVASKVQI
jgi:hypothetical protein